MKEKLKNGARALRDAISELVGSVSGYSIGTVIASTALTLLRMASRLIRRRKARTFDLKNRDIYIK